MLVGTYSHGLGLGEFDIKVEATGLCDGDAGHGGNISLEFVNKSDAAIMCHFKNIEGDLQESEGNFTISISGDYEMKGFIISMGKVLEHLKIKYDMQ
jgi:hypothetical protein